jgi:lipopolysaccharide assembly outer membrane protein LptD (OstA)
MSIRADDLIERAADGQMIAAGGVEVHFRGYVLTSDRLIYNWPANELQAAGNVRIHEPDGSEITADRITLIDEFRDAFLRHFPDVSRKPR